MLRKLLAPIGALLVLTAATSVVAPADVASGTTSLSTEEQAFLTLINNYRQQNGRGKLTVDTKLQDAAEWMSVDMGVHGYFSHTDSLGRDPFQRMAAFGYNYNTWKGENLAAGTSSAQTAFDLWRASSGHDSNMLNADYTAIGVALRYAAGSPYGWYWTTDFGGFLSSPMPPQSSATPTPAPTASPGPTLPGHFLQGDLDCSGAITAVDALVELRYLAGLDVSRATSCSETGMAGASAGGDVDCSSSTTAVDALKILRFVAGMKVDQNEPCPDIGTPLD